MTDTMSEKRETILRLTQDATGKITDVKIFQEEKNKPKWPKSPKPPIIIELKPETKETYLRDLTEGSVVDWGDGTKSTVTAAEAQAKEVKHTYATTYITNRVVTIDGVIERKGEQMESAFDPSSLIAVQNLGELRGTARSLFKDCTSLEAVPPHIFDFSSAVKDLNSCFFNCTSLKEIPHGIFYDFTAVTDFFCCFYNCTSLKAIPAGLFDSCTSVTDFSGCFWHCRSLTGETPSTMVGEKKVKFWNRHPGNGFAKITNYKDCFSDCTKLSDYAEIPDDWK